MHYATADTPTGPWTYHGPIPVSDEKRKGPGHHSFVRDPAFRGMAHRLSSLGKPNRRRAISRFPASLRRFRGIRSERAHLPGGHDGRKRQRAAVVGRSDDDNAAWRAELSPLTAIAPPTRLPGNPCRFTLCNRFVAGTSAAIRCPVRPRLPSAERRRRPRRYLGPAQFRRRWPGPDWRMRRRSGRPRGLF